MDGDSAPGFSGQAVEYLVAPPGRASNFALSATPGSLDISATWDEVDGATSYRLAWRQDGGSFESGNAATVTTSSATITASGYGGWQVRVQGCNEGGCGTEVEQAVTLVLIPGEPENFALSVEAGSLDISATWDALDGASSYKLRWRQSGGSFEAGNAVTVTNTSATITASGYGELAGSAAGLQCRRLRTGDRRDSGNHPRLAQPTAELCHQRRAGEIGPVCQVGRGGRSDFLPAALAAVRRGVRRSGNAATVTDADRDLHRIRIRGVGGSAASLQPGRLCTGAQTSRRMRRRRSA